MRRTAMSIMKDRYEHAALRAAQAEKNGRATDWTSEGLRNEYGFWCHERDWCRWVLTTLREHPLGSTR